MGWLTSGLVDALDDQSQFNTTVSQLGLAAGDRMDNLALSVNGLRDVIVSDYGKLSAFGNIGWDGNADDEILHNLSLGQARWAWSPLFSKVYTPARVNYNQPWEGDPNQGLKCFASLFDTYYFQSDERVVYSDLLQKPSAEYFPTNESTLAVLKRGSFSNQGFSKPQFVPGPVLNALFSGVQIGSNGIPTSVGFPKQTFYDDLPGFKPQNPPVFSCQPVP